MATLPFWTNAQVIGQLDSGDHLVGSSWTYSFPTTTSKLLGLMAR